MANQDWPHGLQPIRRTDTGGVPIVTWYPLKSTMATALYKGQPLVFNNDATHINDGIATNATEGWIGVCAQYIKASSGKTRVPVWRADMHIFSVQCDNSTSTGIAALLFQNFPFLNPDTGSTITGLSSCEADFSGSANTTYKPMRCIGTVKTHDNVVPGTNIDLMVIACPGGCMEQDATFSV
jgi:hypothetical protein